ncbi:MAG: DUF2203 domain-containing protein [Chloroflexi bacterium]|nr:DUF2203 domain-containing protein [Chloroflexota bacterium]
MPRHFTVAEANALLPDVRRIVARMLEARQNIIVARPEVWPVLEGAIGNGGSKKAGELIFEFEKVQSGARRLTQLGIHLKDINTGLVDFLSIRDGREVYLCWRYDEPSVAHWHDLEAGFAGRQAL